MEELLRKLGLNKYEAESYLALLNLGPSSAFNISKNGSVPFGRVYDSLNSLEQKGLVEVVPSKPKKYKAVSPETALNGLLDEQLNNVKKMRSEVDTAVKSFKKADKSDNTVSVSEGMINFAKAVTEHLHYKGEYWATSEGFKLEKKYPALWRYLDGNPKKRYVLVNKDKVDKKRIKELQSYGVNVKSYPLENVRFLVSDEELVTISLQDKGFTNIHIKSKALGKALTKMLKTVWEKSEKV
ncbi:MAG: TrmB family transcriptional regulator [Nanoarchaeota archaeon]|nr:TrmB family transcriptional regulator [Nanoarchaeota archaeon]